LTVVVLVEARKLHEFDVVPHFPLDPVPLNLCLTRSRWFAL
jgi:hypothetical protein